MKKVSALLFTSILMLVSGLLVHDFQKYSLRAQTDLMSVTARRALIDSIPFHNVWTSAQVPRHPLEFSSVGNLMLYGNTHNPDALVLFLSGDGGWDDGAQKMACTIAQNGRTLIVGINTPEYYKKLEKKTSQCVYPAGDLENLSEFVQKEVHLPEYQKPVLLGYSSGAALAYGLLCQAPTGTFRGGIALGFCPDAPLPKPLCEGSGKLNMGPRADGKGYEFVHKAAPATLLEVLNGALDQDCGYEQTRTFFENMENVELIRLPDVGHGFSVFASWLPQFQKAFSRILAATDGNSGLLIPLQTSPIPVAIAGTGTAPGISSNLPLYITPAGADNDKPMVLFLSGDGGWTGFDRQICDELAAKQVPTVGLNSQSYFWKKKTPEQTVNDLAPVVRQYLREWKKSKCILVGYSFGAGIAPFLQNRFPPDLHKEISQIVLLSPDLRCDFEIHVAGMLGHSGGPYDVVAEVRSLQNTPVLCVSGDQEVDEMGMALKGVSHVHFERIPGSHHYNNDAARVAATIF
jgi:type IV secretory pathway VirJ component